MPIVSGALVGFTRIQHLFKLIGPAWLGKEWPCRIILCLVQTGLQREEAFRKPTFDDMMQASHSQPMNSQATFERNHSQDHPKRREAMASIQEEREFDSWLQALHEQKLQPEPLAVLQQIMRRAKPKRWTGPPNCSTGRKVSLIRLSICMGYNTSCIQLPNLRDWVIG